MASAFTVARVTLPVYCHAASRYCCARSEQDKRTPKVGAVRRAPEDGVVGDATGQIAEDVLIVSAQKGFDDRLEEDSKDEETLIVGVALARRGASRACGAKWVVRRSGRRRVGAGVRREAKGHSC